MAKFIEVSTDETLRLIVFHLDSAKSFASKGNMDAANTSIASAQKWMATINTAQLALSTPPVPAQPPEPDRRPQIEIDLEKDRKTIDGDDAKPPIETSATLDIPKRHAALNQYQMPVCMGSYFEQEKGPCTRCKRADACIVLTRTLETDPLHRQNWERANQSDKVVILGNIMAATDPDPEPPRRPLPPRPKTAPPCFSNYDPRTNLVVCASCPEPMKTRCIAWTERGPKEPTKEKPRQATKSTTFLPLCIGRWDVNEPQCRMCRRNEPCTLIHDRLERDGQFRDKWASWASKEKISYAKALNVH